MADKTPTMSVEEYRALKKAGKLEQSVAERHGKPKLEATVQQRTASEGEEILAAHIRLYGLPDPERQYRFHPERRWRFDFAWPRHRLAIEVDGVLWGEQGGHQRPDDYADDCEKLNEAVLLGWRVLRFTPAQVATGEAVLVVQRALRGEAVDGDHAGLAEAAGEVAARAWNAFATRVERRRGNDRA